VTLSYGFDAERGALYFHAAHKGLKLEFIAANPRACASIVEDLGYRNGECAHDYRSAVLFGRMSVVESPDERRHGLHVLIDHWRKDPEAVGQGAAG
jgi:nitroimidazol reductase NimA-like FMN-containing flavoprotein (pyridoxamine 5'-phosphate oxidase superfamily)